MNYNIRTKNHPKFPKFFKDAEINNYALGQLQSLKNQLMNLSSAPNLEVPFINLAILPSIVSRIAATVIDKTAYSNWLLIANFIDERPTQRAIILITLGTINLGCTIELNCCY